VAPPLALEQLDHLRSRRPGLQRRGSGQRRQVQLLQHLVPPVRHPLVRTHPESGRKAIYVNALFTTRIDGFSRPESDAVLAFLNRHVITDEFTVRLSWQPGTVAIWDNRTTQHKPVNDFLPQHRLMHRVTIAGDRPT
jgi:taurine dioxygenase